MATKELSHTIYWNPSSEQLLNSELGTWMKEKGFKNYSEMHAWSVNEKEDFWLEWLKRSGAVFEGATDPIYMPDSQGRFLGGRWFPRLRLNFAENLLKNLATTPVVHWFESKPSKNWSKEDFLRGVTLLQEQLKEKGVSAGDVVAGILPHRPETLMAMLATTSLGAVWTTCSPDFGVQGILDRFLQVKPKILLTVQSTEYGGKTFDLEEKNTAIKSELKSLVATLDISSFDYKGKPKGSLKFDRFSFSHPLYILYSSGTTGAPKCLVHTAGGTLLQHLKELKLHCDLKAKEKIFYFTTCGWMMWNWVVSAIACGAELHTFEGSPSYPKIDSLWERVAQNKIHVFGTSAKYISSCRIAGTKNLGAFGLSSLRLVLSTGSPLLPEDFDYFYSEVSPNKKIQLASISGGTDIVSCFMLGCPVKPVVRGEIQCLGLGMDVKTFDDSGKVVSGEQGELVCTKPFPSMPLEFVNDADFKKYEAAYFKRFPEVWHHGDFVTITENEGVIVHGRSDATLNPGGVRIGTAEIYRQVETIPEIKDSLVVGHMKDGDEKVILFVQLKEKEILTEELVTRLKKKIREGASPRHVPEKILEIQSIPYTLSGKKVEIAVKHILSGQEPKNIEALANPESLDQFRKLSL